MRMRREATLLQTWRLSCLVLVMTLPSCVLELRPVAQPPLITSFTVNGKALDEGSGPIITSPNKLQVEVSVSSQAPLTEIRLLRARVGESYTVLSSCKASPCRYDWNVTVADNGVYCLAVEAEDERGATGSVPYRKSLAIAIPAITTLLAPSALTCQP
jgi:hypothetical protein